MLRTRCSQIQPDSLTLPLSTPFFLPSITHILRQTISRVLPIVVFTQRWQLSCRTFCGRWPALLAANLLSHNAEW